MGLDLAARRNLELTQTMRSKEKRGSLLWVLDQTRTAMGSRLLRSWMERPLLSPAQITKRLGAVEELTKKTIEREELALSLRDVTDFERAMTRIATGACSCRDLASLAQGAQALPEIDVELDEPSGAEIALIALGLSLLADRRGYRKAQGAEAARR